MFCSSPKRGAETRLRRPKTATARLNWPRATGCQFQDRSMDFSSSPRKPSVFERSLALHRSLHPKHRTKTKLEGCGKVPPQTKKRSIAERILAKKICRDQMIRKKHEHLIQMNNTIQKLLARNPIRRQQNNTANYNFYTQKLLSAPTQKMRRRISSTSSLKAARNKRLTSYVG